MAQIAMPLKSLMNQISRKKSIRTSLFENRSKTSAVFFTISELFSDRYCSKLYLENETSEIQLQQILLPSY